MAKSSPENLFWFGWGAGASRHAGSYPRRSKPGNCFIGCVCRTDGFSEMQIGINAFAARFFEPLSYGSDGPILDGVTA